MLRAPVGLFDRFRTKTPRGATPVLKLVAAADIIARYRDSGATEAAAVAATLDQLRALQLLVDDDQQWQRLLNLVDQAGDPWNADDWPLGFDSLLCCVPLCTHVDYECARCPVGRTQDARSCSNPETPIGKINEHIKLARREPLRTLLTDLISKWVST